MKLYCINTDEASRLDIDACKALFPRRTERALKYAKRNDMLLSIGAGMLLAGILGLKEKKILISEYGKPYAADGKTFFGISHSGNIAVTAVDDTPVGVDIELIDESNLTVAPQVLTADEAEWMSENAPTRFYTLWTLKESILKYFGKGLSVNPASFSVTEIIKNGHGSIFGAELFCKTVIFDNYVLSVCTQKPQDEPKPIFRTAKELTENAFLLLQ